MKNGMRKTQIFQKKSKKNCQFFLRQCIFALYPNKSRGGEMKKIVILAFRGPEIPTAKEVSTMASGLRLP